MVKLIPAKDRHFSATNWLSSYFLFSFADYFDPHNMHFGPLRVFNDDTVAAHAGFPPHPHSEMEIVSIVLEGQIEHEDNLGNKAIIRAGEVQRITAGTGIVHSEKNNTDKPAHFYQLWFIPNKKNLRPSYEQRRIDFNDTKNELIPLVTGQKVLEDVVYMNSNSTIYYCHLKQDKEIDFATFDIRKTFIYLITGEAFVNGVQTLPNDQARVEKVELVSVKATQDSRFILIDVPAVEANY